MDKQGQAKELYNYLNEQLVEISEQLDQLKNNVVDADISNLESDRKRFAMLSDRMEQIKNQMNQLKNDFLIL